MVKFDIESDTRFQSCLEDLSAEASIDILQALSDISDSACSWSRFVQTYGWQPMNWQGDNTYPGANEIHYFYVKGASDELYEVFGYKYSDDITERMW